MTQEQAAPFRPKQAVPITPQAIKLIIGEASSDVAQGIISKYLTPLPENSRVHDNGCGTGVFTTTLLGGPGKDAAGLEIDATDVNPKMLEVTTKMLAMGGWQERARLAPMDAERLDFPDAHFTHSAANFLIYTGLDSHKCATEMHRTLKPGGKAFVSSWSDIVHDAAMLEAHELTRPKDTPHPMHAKQEWKNPEHMKKALKEGGFAEVETVMVDGFVDIKDLREWAGTAWSCLGAAIGGWTQNDEERWDEAVDLIRDRLSESDKVVKKDDGTYRYRMGAVVGVATK